MDLWVSEWVCVWGRGCARVLGRNNSQSIKPFARNKVYDDKSKKKMKKRRNKLNERVEVHKTIRSECDDMQLLYYYYLNVLWTVINLSTHDQLRVASHERICTLVMHFILSIIISLIQQNSRLKRISFIELILLTNNHRNIYICKIPDRWFQL